MNLTPNEVLIIALVALVVLGPQRLPEAARQIGKGYRELRKMSTSVRAEIDNAIKEPVEAIRQPIEEITSSFSETLHAGDDDDPSARRMRQDREAAAEQRPEQPNSTYRPADELDVEPAADTDEGGTASP